MVLWMNSTLNTISEELDKKLYNLKSCLIRSDSLNPLMAQNKGYIGKIYNIYIYYAQVVTVTMNYTEPPVYRHPSINCIK